MQRATREKDPAAITAEKLLHSFANDDPRPLLSALDPTVSFQSPMGVFYGRPYVKSWLEFEVELLRPFAHMVRHHATVAEDGLKVGRVEWSVGGLYVTDTVTQTQVLTIRSIKRHVRRDCKTQHDHDITEALLLAWTGPHFSKYCAARGRGVDNRAIVLPVLDYSFMEMRNVRSLLIKEPQGGRVISDDSVVFHFLQDAIATDQHAADAAKQADNQNAGENSKQTFGESSASAPGKKVAGASTITIQAKNRAGEVNAIIIDRSSLEGKAGDQSRLDMLEDSELQVRRDRNRYVCSGIRLSNNAFTQVKELDHVLRIYIVNAFYFVTLVDLSTNQLTEIPNLSQLMSLQTLYLHDNKIADWHQVETLQTIPLLNTLTLFGNPLQQNAPSAKTYKFNVLYFFYAAEGFRAFSTRQQTLQHAATATATASRPSSRMSNAGRTATATSEGGRGRAARSPSPMLRAPTPALATRGGGGGPSHCDAPAPTIVKIRLRQLDHCVISPLEVETLEQFMHVIKRRLKRTSSPASGDPKLPGIAPTRKVA